MKPIEGYAHTTSIFPGETLDLHIRTEPPHTDFIIEIYRLGPSESLVHQDRGTAEAFATPDNAYEVGCGWPVTYSLQIPNAWSSGVYRVRCISEREATVETEILFVVKERAPGNRAKILMELAVNTYQAYNSWGGKSLYGFNSTNGVSSVRVSFDRPDRYEDFYLWEYPLIRWLESQGFMVAYCTNIDLHTNANFLNHFSLLVSVGHDEYWSWEMRDNVEAFIAQGGNVAFFGGNLCWWQVRLEDNDRVMVCYKKANDDPFRNSNANRVTVNWKDPPVERPENQMTGVSFAQGAGWFNSDAGERPKVGYRVSFEQHWVFAGTGLRNGDEFGAEDGIIGYETDAAVLREGKNGLRATGEDGTPRNFVVLATADLRGWQRGGQAGMATMGIYRNRGMVFTGATVDWTRGLLGIDPFVPQITNNIIRQLDHPRPNFPEIINPDFNDWIDTEQPSGWGKVEGAGSSQQERGASIDGQLSLKLDGTKGQTWLIQGPFTCEKGQYYSIGGWIKSNRPSATLRLQSMLTWQDFVIAEHSGSGQWEYVFAVGKLDSTIDTFPARVKLEVAPGVVALFHGIDVDRL